MSPYKFTVWRSQKDGSIVEDTTERSELKGDEVYLDVTHSGVCGTDIHYLSFATGAVRKESFVWRIPDGMSSEDAAPLMCGGITVWVPLTMHGVKPSDTVGVVGMGGLGHLAIQFARAMGCEVVVFSQTESKKEDAMRLGATTFIATQGKKDLTSLVPRKVHHLLVTTSEVPDWDLFFPILAQAPSIYPLTATSMDAKLSLPYMPFLLKGAKVISSMPTRQSVNEMLEFATRNKIHPVIEREPMSTKGIENILDRLKQGKVRYRGVLCKQC
ncbi:Alcohol dehydrogenase protein [Rutstroemia sp. NJR-2017a WRK4]|nr:Alcohol dehydrogenase protein [Rutstroemia sp. NJR-2017a WRK4]